MITSSAQIIGTPGPGVGGGGSGTVTHTGALTLDHVIIGNGGTDIKADTQFTTDGAGNLTALSLNMTAAADATTPSVIKAHSATQSAPIQKITAFGYTPSDSALLVIGGLGIPNSVVFGGPTLAYIEIPSEGTFPLVFRNASATAGTGLVIGHLSDNGDLIITFVQGGTSFGAISQLGPADAKFATGDMAISAQKPAVTLLTDYVSLGRGENAGRIGFFETTPVAIKTITGSRGSATVAVLTALLAALGGATGHGLIIDSTTA